MKKSKINFVVDLKIIATTIVSQETILEITTDEKKLHDFFAKYVNSKFLYGVSILNINPTKREIL